MWPEAGRGKGRFSFRASGGGMALGSRYLVIRTVRE